MGIGERGSHGAGPFSKEMGEERRGKERRGAYCHPHRRLKTPWSMFCRTVSVSFHRLVHHFALEVDNTRQQGNLELTPLVKCENRPSLKSSDP